MDIFQTALIFCTHDVDVDVDAVNVYVDTDAADVVLLLVRCRCYIWCQWCWDAGGVGVVLAWFQYWNAIVFIRCWLLVLELEQLRYHVKTTHERCGPFSLVVEPRRGRVATLSGYPAKTTLTQVRSTTKEFKLILHRLVVFWLK